jgi:hypothetical protein
VVARLFQLVAEVQRLPEEVECRWQRAVVECWRESVVGRLVWLEGGVLLVVRPRSLYVEEAMAPPRLQLGLVVVLQAMHRVLVLEVVHRLVLEVVVYRMYSAVQCSAVQYSAVQSINQSLAEAGKQWLVIHRPNGIVDCNVYKWRADCEDCCCC